MPWLCITGEHERRGYHAYLHGVLTVVPQNPFEYSLELCTVCLEEPGAWLYNCESFSCNGFGRDGVPVDCDAVARDRNRHLRKYLPHEVETGRKAYRLFKHLGQPVVERAVLNIPYLEPNIVARLRKVLDSNGDKYV
jgi:hypothetical protein